MTSLADVDAAVLRDTADAIGRTGAASLEVGFLDDTPPHRWYATAQYEGAKVSCDNQVSPVGAVLGLYAMLATGGRCTHCGRTVALEQANVGLVDGARMRQGNFESHLAARPRDRYCVRSYEGGWPTCATVQADTP